MRILIAACLCIISAARLLIQRSTPVKWSNEQHVAHQQSWSHQLELDQQGLVGIGGGLNSMAAVAYTMDLLVHLGVGIEGSSGIGIGNSSALFSANLIAWATKEIDHTRTDTDAWPELRSLNQWDTDLANPHVYVLSLQGHQLRRANFAAAFQKIGWKLSEGAIHWVPAINGSQIPAELIDPSQFPSWVSPPAVGCLLTHFMVIDRHLKNCPTCDMIVFEDDVTFHPDFHELWTDFSNSLQTEGNQPPPAHLHLGGDAFWLPPDGEGSFHYRGGWISRTWGYVLKAAALRTIISSLQGHSNAAPIDMMLSGSTDVRSSRGGILTFSPKLPLVRAWALGSTTVHGWDNFNEGVSSVSDHDVRQKSCWWLAPCTISGNNPSCKSSNYRNKQCEEDQPGCIFCPRELEKLRLRL